MEKTSSLSRRHFVEGAGLAAGAALAAGAVTSAAKADEADAINGCTYEETIPWNTIYDVVVVGFGGAGATAARFAADAGAKVLLIDKAPAGHEGGNSRYCAQIVCMAYDEEEMLEYLRGMAWKFEYDDEVLQVFAAAEAGMQDYFRTYLGVEPFLWKNNPDIPESLALGVNESIPEYPELPGGNETVNYCTVNFGMSNAACWRNLRDHIAERTDNITVWLDSPAVSLIQDPYSQTILGVEVQHDGENVLVKATNGVCMTCGGFENNVKMIQDYMGATRLYPCGTLYNEGDGIKMATAVGADLYHMFNYEASAQLMGGMTISWQESTGHARLTQWPIADGALILVGDDGSRFLKEDTSDRHGRVYCHGVWRQNQPMGVMHMIFDQTKYDYFMDNYDSLPNTEFLSRIISASTPEELAEKIDADPDILAKQISDWNFMCENGNDIQFGREPESMLPFDGEMYYASEVRKCMVNTQGGPRRNAQAQIMDINGEAIPHLYSAGEFGGLATFQYQGGQNMAENLIFGKIAGENAAVPKDDVLPVIPGLIPVDNDIKEYSCYDFASEYVDVELGPNQYMGTTTAGIGGVIQVVLTMDGDTITDCEVVNQCETDMYGEAALMILPMQVIEANGTDIDGVAGASTTTMAFKEAVEDALSQVR